MSYGQYPFWKDVEVRSARANADKSRREANDTKEQLEAIKNEIDKYKTFESDNISITELTKILDKISEIISK